MSFKLVFKRFYVEKDWVLSQKWLNQFNRLRNQSTGCARLVEDWLREAKKFLSFPVAFSSQSSSFSSRLRIGRGLVEANGHLPSI